MKSTKKQTVYFPKSFLWGASISTHQVEGGNHNQWSIWELETARVHAAKARYQYQHLPIWKDIRDIATQPENYVSGKACDHYNLYEEDFMLAKKLNFSALRCGIEWSRIEPEEGEFSKKALQHYKQYFTSLEKQGITPVITLWHWTFPEWFAKKGGFEKRSNVKYFVRYVRYVSEQLGMHFKYVIVLNEPTIYASVSYHEERWPPEKSSKLQMWYVLRNLAAAHRRSYRVIHKLRPKAKVGIAHNCGYYYAGDDSIISKVVAWGLHKVMNEYFINLVRRQQDFFGLNFYFAHRILGTRSHNPNEHQNDLGWDMQPDKLGLLVQRLYKRYQLPVMVTESGTADMHDQYRQWWIRESITSMNAAIGDGAKMIGYIHWSLLDNFEWAEGFWPRFGLIEVDYKTQKRTVRQSAKWYGSTIRAIRERS